jgi:hypothetical protein
MDDVTFQLNRAKLGWKSTTLTIKASIASIKTAMAGLASAAATMGRLIGKAFFWLSMVTIAVEAIKAAFDHFYPATDAVKKQQKEVGELTDKYKKALNLNKDLKEVNSLISANLEIKDSLNVTTTTEVIGLDTTKITFESSDDFGNGNSRLLTGFTDVKFDTSINQFSVLMTRFELTQTLSLMAAIENVDGADRLKLSTSYPGLVIKDIENINLVNTRLNRKDQKKSRWMVGFGVGYGINLNNNQVISTGPSIGVGLYFSPKFLQF